jgi:hypothetical protein
VLGRRWRFLLGQFVFGVRVPQKEFAFGDEVIETLLCDRRWKSSWSEEVSAFRSPLSTPVTPSVRVCTPTKRRRRFRV